MHSHLNLIPVTAINRNTARRTFILIPNRIGLFGGTFDPIHNAHLRVANEALIQCELSKVIFIPNSISPFKTNFDVTDAHHRLAMVQRAVAGNPHFDISDVEILRSGPSFTVETLRHFKSVLNKEAELFFIIGADAVAEIEKWHEFEEVLRLCKVAVVARPGTNWEQVIRELKPATRDRIVPLKMTESDISSTMIRERAKAGLDIGDLVPKEVERYIVGNKLFIK